MTIAEERAARNANLHERRKALSSEGMSDHGIAEKLGIKVATVLICKKQP